MQGGFFKKPPAAHRFLRSLAGAPHAVVWGGAPRNNEVTLMPIWEYEREEAAAEGLRVQVTVTSAQSQLGDGNLFGFPDGIRSETAARELVDLLLQEDWPEEDPEDAGGEYHMNCEGTLTEQAGMLELRYEELSPDPGEKFTAVRLAFPVGMPGPVCVERSGEAQTMFTVEEGRRQYSVYRTPFGSMELCVYGKRIENSMGPEGGELQMDYAIELQGMTAQRTKMKITVRRPPQDPGEK